MQFAAGSKWRRETTPPGPSIFVPAPMARSRIPPTLKRWLIPVWNSAHQYAWLTYDYLNACGHGRTERCKVCGHLGLMLYRRRVIPPRLVELWGLTPQLASALARKESGDCSRCGAKLRARRLVQVLLSLYPVGHPPAPARSLARWVEHPEIQALRVAEINRIDGLHEVLARLRQFSCSDYHPGAPPGAIVDGVRCEDLTRLTYPGASFDLVLTSETLEHVPDLVAALSEIRRILVPGGRHIFTIPLLPGVAQTFARSVVRLDGSIEDLATRICHPGGDVGYPVFTEFGADLPLLFERAGFELDVYFAPNCAQDLAQVYVCRKISD
jgi:SAM-dependent methyltransferase